MGYTFEIVPSGPVNLTLGEVCERATVHLRRYLSELCIDQLVTVSEELAAAARRRLRECATTVFVAPVVDDAPLGGAELSFSSHPGQGEGSIRPAQGAESHRAFHVVRTMGQPVLAALAHGFVAGALAEMTGGSIRSPDGAGGGGDAGPFLRAFMNPHSVTCDRFRLLAEERMRQLPEALEAFDCEFAERVLEEIITRLVRDVNEVRGDPDRELAAFDRALDHIETTRFLAGTCNDLDRRLLIGDGYLGTRATRPSALVRLQPTPEEYARWMRHLGDMLV